MGHYMYYPAGRGESIFGLGYGFLSTLFIIFAVIFIVVMLLKVGKSSSMHESDDEALNILKRRYAKGDIDKKQFQEMKKDIG